MQIPPRPPILPAMPDPDMPPAEQKAYEEALKRIAECTRRRATVLDLSRLGLACLPPNIGQLVKLTELNLAHNHLSSLPPELGQLACLSRLDLSNNNLAALPPELGQLASLTLLYLSNNPLHALPPQLGQLASLTRLDLSNNPLRALPPELGELASLTRLDLSNNRLGSLPPQLGQLTSLTRLFLSNNPLGALPPELGRLANLTRLYLSNNQLEALPPELGQLAKLTVLDLSHNSLGALPPELGGLVNLTEFNLDNNHLAALPPELGQLARLTVLRLMTNRLTGVPEALRQLEMLEKLFLHENPALQLSPAVLGPDPRQLQNPRIATPKSILDYYFSRQEGKTRPLNEVKLILVGACGAGKTSIVQALRDLPFREREESTPGIALSECTIDGGEGQPVTVHLWDCSGQPICHLLHPLFFSPRNLFVVVLGGRDHREREDAQYWLRLIHASAADEQGQGPPVIVALNQWNLPGCRPEVDRGMLREHFPFIRGFVEMDCKVKKGVAALKAALFRELERMPWVREPFPEEWDDVRRSLVTAPQQRGHLTYAQYRDECAGHGVEDQGQQDYLSEILNHIGAALLYRNDPSLDELTLLKPEWLTRHLYALLHRAEKRAGVLNQADVDMVLQAEPDEPSRAYLMQILEHLAIAYAAPTANGTVWLLPRAMPDAPPAGLDAFRDAAEAICLRYTYQSLPDGLVARLSVRRFEFVEELREHKQLWRGGVVISRKGARVFIRTAAQDRQVLLTVTGPTMLRRQLADLCQAEIHDIHAASTDPEPIAETLVHGKWMPSSEVVHEVEPESATTDAPIQRSRRGASQPPHPAPRSRNSRSRSPRRK